jgi:hypothetical protein
MKRQHGSLTALHCAVALVVIVVITAGIFIWSAERLVRACVGIGGS